MDIYENPAMHVKINQDMTTDKIQIRREVLKTKDIIATRLLILALEDVFKKLQWHSRGLNIDDSFVVLVFVDPDRLKIMQELKQVA